MTDKEQKDIFARNLNHLLSVHNKSQREVAEAIDVSPQTFNTWCQAIAIPRMGKVQRLADYFNIPKSHLIDEINDKDFSDKLRRTLTQDESDLLDDFQKLNAEGKSEARKQVRNLTKIEDYTKDTGSSAPAAG